MQTTFAFFIGTPGPAEMMVILGIGVLLFGSRLPEVGRSLGKGIMEFKKGVQGLEDDASPSSSSSSSQAVAQEAPAEISAPKFEAPASEPTQDA